MPKLRLPWPRRPLAKFLLAFVLLYSGLLLPWPGLADAYRVVFIKTLHLVFSDQTGQRAVWFELPTDPLHRETVNLCIAYGPSFRQNHGAGLVRTQPLPAAGFGWQPTALLMALFLATPVALKRRLAGLAFALLAFHLLLWAGLSFMIWNDSAYVGLVALSERQLALGEDIKKIIAMTLSGVFPLLSWLLFALAQPGLLMFAAPFPARPRPVSAQ